MRGALSGQALEAMQLVDGDGMLVQRMGAPRLARPKCPKTLYDLWKEFMFGYAGNKPAKDFTSHERGECRHVYSKRNVVWSTIVRMIDAGYTADRAIDKIYDAYGHRTSNIDIIKMLARDNKH
jgi:hypothetical protein